MSEGPNNNGIVLAEGSGIFDPTRFAIEIEQRIKVIDRIHEILNSKLDPERDINRVHGAICRNKNAARIAYRTFGGTFIFVKDEHNHPILLRKDHKDSKGVTYYTYECFGRYTPPFGAGDAVEASGFASSRDNLLGVKDEEFRPTDDVCEAHVRQASQTECFKKCIFLGLGLTDLNEEDLKKLGVNTDKTTGYKGSVKGSTGGSTDTEDEQTMRSDISRMCNELYKTWGMKNPTDKPFMSADAVLKTITANDKFPGWNAIKAVSKKALKRTHAEVVEYHKENEDPLPM